MAAICVWISTFASVCVPFLRFPSITPPHESFLSDTSHYDLGAVVRTLTRAPISLPELNPRIGSAVRKIVIPRETRHAGMIIWIRLSALVLTPRCPEDFRGPERQADLSGSSHWGP
jgi:hypothetical protein